MDEDALQVWRLERLRGAAAQFGSAEALARALGHRNGGFIRQMLRNRRKIKEDTIFAIEDLAGMQGWFDRQDAAGSVPRAAAMVARSTAQQKPRTLAALMDELGDRLQHATPSTRKAVADLLSTYALNPAEGRNIAQAIVMLIENDPRAR
ncbi:hypothetical protein THIX_30350 [Thiomonas sp. X19]|uniref:hypothetical protein n=1 Tax=Thiomonas sp. X19 TaxID=1050370 RepID=UPI000B67A97A|nr:hypothetical protein [Thiomonas sp. X19]SCC93122.1 hypothetical protein THIX_30350 [Thiomonas sp. X19]